MNKNFYSFFFCCLAFHVLSVVPEWDLSAVGEDLLGSNTEITLEINHRNLFNLEMIMKKKLTKTNEGIKIANLLTIAGTEKEVDFDQVESYYNLFNIYIVCPKGSYHPYDFTNEKEIKPNNFSGENWDLRCYKHDKSGYFLVFYLMNGKNMNMYLTNMQNIYWYGGASIEKSEYKETYDYLLKGEADQQFGTYQMISVLNEENNITLVYLAYKLEQGNENQYVNSYKRKGIIEKGRYTQAYFRNSTENDKYFYYFTYNNITDFKSGYSTSSINVNDNFYERIENVQIQNNDNPHLEFFDNMKIEKMEFLLYNKFIYYRMQSLNNNEKYYGIFDVKLNKIIFNTKEEINEFIPYNDKSMLAVTKEKAYKICAYKENNNCIDICSNNYLLDIEGNTCGTECRNGKLPFMPLGVCINKCDENYYVINNNKCGLCKDMNSSYPYKLIGGTDCLNEIIDDSYLYNANLKLLKCNTGYHLENNKCILDKQCYELCKECTEISDNETDQKCSSCLDGFDLDGNNNCVCPSGKEKINKNCLSCSNKCDKYKINKCDCEVCPVGFFLENGQCKQCSDDFKCDTTEKNTCKCASCKQNYFLYNSECYECNSDAQCDTYEDNEKCKCKKCNAGYYNNNYSCNRCSENCYTCDGGYFDELNHHCLSCNNNTENKYLINKEDKHICVSDCTKYNGTNNLEKNICEFSDDHKKKRGVDYMIWIFFALFGVLLIIIFYSICKTFIYQKKNEIDSIEEIKEGELMEK